MRISMLCWAGALLLALPGCGDDGDADPPGGDAELCDNGQDDDADGLVDCSDSDCAASCPAACGDGAIDMGEACDGAELGGQTCERLGSPGGTLACTATCTLDTSGCAPTSDACGDGAIDMGEACDGAELGGQTCEGLGFDGGTLACSAACALDPSGCTSGPAEICGNGQDDDGNGLADCEDPACADEAICGGDSCSEPVPLADGVPVSSDTTGGIEMTRGSCSGTGDETTARVHVFTTGGSPGELGLMHIDLESITDQGFYVRADCADEASEVACMDIYGGGANEVLDLPIEGVQTVYVYVDGWSIPEDNGPYTLTVTWTPIGDEDICDDLEDNDFDKLPDCADPSCQATATCEPGMTPTGSPCDAHDQCAANASDPICLGESTYGWPEGYCSEVCDLAMNDCASGATCVSAAGLPPDLGFCLDPCAAHSDCRSGYHCDYALEVCVPGDAPEICDNGVDDNGDGVVDCEDTNCQETPLCPELVCDDLTDNNDNVLVDCEDASCQATAACAPGTGAAGAPCDANTDCAANNNDPVCFSEQLTDWPDGYCAEHCDLAANDCASGATCVDMGLPSGNGYCLDQCATVADCRPGYVCEPGLGNVCFPGFSEEICDNGVDDTGDGLVDCEDPLCASAPTCPEAVCDDIHDNDQNGLTDCQDPLCQATAACTPGTGAAGAPCAAASDCAADASDPFCITEAWNGWPGGYCSQFCDLAGDDCPSGEVCLDAAVSATGGICFDLCTTDADCRAGYHCLDVGGSVNICFAE